MFLKITILLATLCAVLAHGGQEMRVLHAIKADTAYFFLTAPPRVGQGFHVERKGPSDKDYVRLTKKPVEAVVSAAHAAVIIGPKDFQDLKQALSAASPEQLLLKLRTDNLAGMVYTMLYHRVGEVLGRFYTAGGHEKGKKYQYRFVFVNRKGKVLSTIKREVVAVEKAPVPPEKVKGRQDKRTVEVNWKYSKWKMASGDMAVRFNLYRKAGRKKFERVKTKILLRLEGVKLEYIDESIKQGGEYAYYLTAVDAAGLESKPSAEVKVKVKDVFPPSMPSGLTPLVAQDKVELIWRVNPEPDVIAYNVFRWEGMGKDSLKLNKKPIKARDPRFTDTATVIGKQYYYAVAAIDKAGNQGPYCSKVQAFPTDTVVPGKVGDLKAVVEKRTVRLTWTKPSDRDIRGYKVMRGFLEGGKMVYLTPDPVSAATFTDKGKKERLEPGRKYRYAVCAVDSAWHQGDTAMVCVSITDNEPPMRPGAVLARNDFGRGVRLSWNRSPSLDVTAYKVVRKQGKKSLDMGMVPAAKPMFFDSTAKKTKTYVYEITALDSSKNMSPATASEPVLVKDFTGPPRPNFTAAVYDGKKVLVRWERVVDFDLAGYNVYRAALSTGAAKKINKKPIKGLEFEDRAGKKGLWYSVRALDTSGNEGRPSEPVRAVEKKLNTF